MLIGGARELQSAVEESGLFERIDEVVGRKDWIDRSEIDWEYVAEQLT